MKLTDHVGKLPMIGPSYVNRLEKLEIETVRDLLYHVPVRYQDFSKVSKIKDVKPNEILTIEGKLTFIKNQYTRTGKRIQFAEITDNTGKLGLVWFNQPYLINILRKGTHASFSGKVDLFGNKFSLISPEFELEKDIKIHTGRLIPIYSQTLGVSSKWLRGRINQALLLTKDQINEYFPKNIINKYKLNSLKKAISDIHFPEKLEDAENAKRRLAFDELLMLHLESSFRKIDWKENSPVLKLKIDHKSIKSFIESLPFSLTQAQTKAVDEILKDLNNDTPMNRLLEGDVGSGKTVVAAAAAFAVFLNGYQSAIMAPTQILVQQHYDTFRDVFKKYKIRIKLFTSEGEKGDPGKTDVFIGTHALIHNKASFDKTALVIVDEQHRFGVEQRAHLIKKTGSESYAPHVLTMTATPIPRTIALTAYGDLDLSILDELPEKRLPISTWIVPPNKRNDAYEWIKNQINEKKTQAFVICPLIEESQVESMKQIKAAKAEYNNLVAIFKGFNVGLLHGKQKADEKNKIINKFKNRKIDILVSTPVVEVGIDIPNATIMIIEGADRFGLAQLHQLRGRVGRGEEKSYCLLFTQNKSKISNQRLSALKKHRSGFKLAEIDLTLRGPGEILGLRQHGQIGLKIASWQDSTLISTTKKLADEIIGNQKKYKLFLKKIKGDKVVFN